MGGGGGSGRGGQGGCERRIEVFVKIQNKLFFFLGGGGGWGGGGQSGCERRIEDFVGGSLFPIEKPMFPNLTLP